MLLPSVWQRLDLVLKLRASKYLLGGKLTMQFLIPAYLLVPGMTLCFEPDYFNYVIEEAVLDYAHKEVKVVSSDNTRVEWLPFDDKVWVISSRSSIY